MAAGDVLVTIKAKYDSVDAALKTLKGIDQAIVGINKKGGIKIGAAGASRDVRGLTKSLEVAGKAVAKFKGKALGMSVLRRDFTELNEQLQSATEGLNTGTNAAYKHNAALTLLAGNFKKLQITSQAYRTASRNLFKDTGASPGGKKPGTSRDFLPNIESFAKGLKTIAKGPSSLFEISSLLEEIQFIFQHTIEDSADWKTLLEAENSLLEKQASLQKKISDFQEKKVEAARKGATMADFLPPRPTRHQIQDYGVPKPGLHQMQAFPTQRPEQGMYPYRFDDWIKDFRDQGAPWAQEQGGPGGPLADAAEAYERWNQLRSDWNKTFIDNFNAWDQAKNDWREDQRRQLEDSRKAQDEWEVANKKHLTAQEKLQNKRDLEIKEWDRLAKKKTGATVGFKHPNRTGIPAYDQMMETEKHAAWKFANEFNQFSQLPDTEKPALEEILRQLVTDPIDDVVKRLKVDYDKVGKAATKASQGLNQVAQSAKGADAKDWRAGEYGPRMENQGRYDFETGRRLSTGERFDRRFSGGYGGGGGGGRYGRVFGEGGNQLPNRGFRNMRRGMRRGLGSKMGQNMLLGGGFPMLFGGGAGAVGGSLLGTGMAGMMGMPGAGFGLQIMGSALGTMVEGSLREVNKLAEALSELNMDHLLDSGIRLTAEMQAQVQALEKQGKYAEARKVMEAQIYKQTGGSAGTYKNIERSVDILSAGWDDLKNSVGLTLSILAAPFLVALGAISTILGAIFNVVNRILTGLGDIIGWFGQFVRDDTKKAWNDMWDRLSKSTQKARANMIAITAEMNKQTGKDAFIFENVTERLISNPQTLEDKQHNDRVQRVQKLIDFEEKLRKIREDHFKSDSRKKLEADDPAAIAADEALERRIELLKKKELHTYRTTEADLAQALALRDLKNANEEANTEDAIRLANKQNELRAKSEGMFGQSTSQAQQALDIRLKMVKAARKLNEIELQKGANFANTRDYKNQLNIIKGLENEYRLNRLNNDEITRQTQLWRQVGDAIENSIVRALENAITKAESLQDIASSLLRSVGRMFLQAGVSSLMSGINFGGGGGNMSSQGYFNPNTGVGVAGPNYGILPKLAEGGYVSGPTNALIGEGGEPEYVIPQSKMSDAMSRYAGGARGEDVLAGGGDDLTEGGTTASTGGSIDVRFNTERINDVSYVTFEQFQAGVQQAAIEGAKKGEQGALRRLQTSASTRRTVGM